MTPAFEIMKAAPQYRMIHVGSKALLGVGGDSDYAVYLPCPSDIPAVVDLLISEGWVPGGSTHEGKGGEDFCSLKYGDCNILVCGPASYARYEQGHRLCMALRDAGARLECKPMRVFLYRIAAGESIEVALVEANKYRGES